MRKDKIRLEITKARGKETDKEIRVVTLKKALFYNKYIKIPCSIQINYYICAKEVQYEM